VYGLHSQTLTERKRRRSAMSPSWAWAVSRVLRGVVAPSWDAATAHAVHHALLVASATTPAAGFKPTAGALPGGNTLLTLVNGLGGWALILSLAGLVIGAALWAVGAHSQNYQQSFVGKRAVLVSGVAALIIGAAPTIIDFFFHTGLHLSVGGAASHPLL
jgi:hypothetical protein